MYNLGTALLWLALAVILGRMGVDAIVYKWLMPWKAKGPIMGTALGLLGIGLVFIIIGA